MKSIAKYPWFLFTLLIFLPIATACSTDETPTHTPSVQEVEFAFRLSVPEAENYQLSPQIRTQTAEETKIHNAVILVFTQEGGTGNPFKYAYHIKTGLTSTNHPFSSFKARLKTSSVPVKIYLLANTSIPTQIAEPTVGQTEENVKNQLVMTAPAGIMTASGIPMWGEYLFASGISPEYNRQIDGIKMHRAMSKVSISLSPSLSANFAITGVYLARARSQVLLVPHSVSSTGLVVAPNVPSTATALLPISISSTGSSFYVPEDEGFATAAQLATGVGSKDNTCIIVSGRLNGSAETFYRIDLKQDNVYGRSIRNHHYQIQLTGVSQNGESSLQAALDLTRPTMIYESKEFILGLGLTTIVFDGFEQLSAAEKQVILAPNENVKDLLISPGDINTAVDIARFNSGSVIGGFGQSATLTDINATAQIIDVSGVKTLRINSASNTGSTDLTDQLLIKTPTKTLLINIVKKNANSVGISAIVQGSSNPQRAEFLSSGGDKIVEVSSASDWDISGVPSWIRVNKISNTQFSINVVGLTSSIPRESVISVKNKTGDIANIEVYQMYTITWSNAYSEGGDHETTLQYDPRLGVTYTFRAPTPAGTPLRFARRAANVGKITLNRIGTSDNNPNIDMHGDYYHKHQAANACPPGWRLPTYLELVALMNNLQFSSRRTFYIVQNGETIYFPTGNIVHPEIRLLYSSEAASSSSQFQYSLFLDNETGKAGITFAMAAEYVRCVK